MRFDRYFTRRTPDPYEGVPFRSLVAETGLEMIVPAAWDEAAAGLLVEKVLGQTLFPVVRVAVAEKGVPLWLCPKAAESRNGPEIFEIDIRQVIDRLAGFWTYRSWKVGSFEGDEENARVFYDEIRHILLHQMASPPLIDWMHAGFSWAYGVGAPDPAALPVRPVENFDMTAPDALLRISRKSRDIFKNMALAAGRRLLLSHLDAVIESYSTPDFASKVERARNADVPEGALGDALLYARQGYKKFPAFDEDDQQEENVIRSRVRITDSFMGEVLLGADAGGRWQNLAGAIWSGGGPEMRFSSDRDIFAPADDVYVPSCSVSLVAFLPPREGSPFMLEAYARTCRLLTVALDGLALAGHGRSLGRPLALGFSGLSKFLELRGLAYDSEQAKAMATGLAAILSGSAWKASVELAGTAGVFSGFEQQSETFLSLLCRQRGLVKGIGGDAVKKIPVLRAEYCPDLALVGSAETLWDGVVSLAEKAGVHNSCVTAFASDNEIDTLLGTLSGNPLRPEAEILMRAAIQPFLGGFYGGTVVLPRDISVEEIAGLMQLAWSHGLVNLSLYREGSEMQYPLSLLEMEERAKAPPVQKELIVLSEPPNISVKKPIKKKKVSDG